MTDRPRSQGRNLHANPKKRAPRPNSRRGGKPGGTKTNGRSAPHPRTTHDLDPRQAGFDTLRRLKPGDLLAPAVEATLKHQGRPPELAHRVIPMLEDATRFAFLFDHLIAHMASRPSSELDADVRAALHLFLAWYLLDDPRAVYAHGNAAVELLPAKHKARGFVNALVRRLGEFVRVEAAAADDYRALAVTNEAPELFTDRCRLGTGRMLVAERDIFPDPAKELAKHLAIVGSIPQLLADKLLGQHGSTAATQIALAGIEHPATWIRPNPLRVDITEMKAWWTRAGVSVESVDLPADHVALALPGRAPRLTDHPAWDNGGFYVQDYSAQLVAPALGAKPGEMILDLCSAPGGKATHLAELTKDNARILACDLTEPKVERIHQNIRRLGYSSIATVQADASEVKFPEKFDRILIDAPCSNSGVLARRVEARHRVTDAALSELAGLQRKILDNAAANLKPGGTIVYSVCSILMEEGPDVIHKFLKGNDDWEIDQEIYTLPVPAWHDGGYIARLKSPAA